MKLLKQHKLREKNSFLNYHRLNSLNKIKCINDLYCLNGLKRFKLFKRLQLSKNSWVHLTWLYPIDDVSTVSTTSETFFLLLLLFGPLHAPSWVPSLSGFDACIPDLPLPLFSNGEYPRQMELHKIYYACHNIITFSCFKET